MSVGHFSSFQKPGPGSKLKRMLSLLRIHNLALVSSAELRFGAGLNVLTGESGSGKSVILDSLALISGATRPRLRARTGCRSGLAEGEFWPPRDEKGALLQPPLVEALDAHGLLEACSDPNEPIVLARRIEASGRSRCFIQGQTVNRATLSAIGEELVELCGQSEAHGLRTPAAQLEALDQFGGLVGQRRALSRQVKKLKAQEAECEKARLEASEAERRRDFLEFQIDELERCDVSDLPAQRARLDELQAAEHAENAHRDVLSVLQTDDRSVLSQLQSLTCRLDDLDDEAAQLISTTLHRTVSELQDTALLAAAALQDGPAHHGELSELSEKLEGIDRLAQKHRIACDALPARLEDLKQQLQESKETEKRHQNLMEQARDLRCKSEKAAERLHLKRRHAASQLEHRVHEELKKVGLEGATLETHLSRGELGHSGITHLDIGFSANPGHDPQPLSRVASGGELARVLLCFRLATDASGALLTFDEIDAGAGGKTADKIAQALARAGSDGQVLCVTHWAQVAGAAATHFSVSKATTEGQAATTIMQVEGDSRLREISRMLGGSEQTAREHASRLVQAA